MDSAQPIPPGPPPMSYWKATRLPIYSILIVLPFITVYEIGLIVMRSRVMNGGDALLLNLGGPILRYIGMGASLASVAALIVYFAAWQIKKKAPLKVETPKLAGMFVESLIYAVILFQLLGFCVQYLPKSFSREVPVRSSASELSRPQVREREAQASAGVYRGPRVEDFVLYCGAGVYEEFVFRVLLLGLLMLTFTKLFHMESAYAAAWAVVVGAIIFSAFHHIGGEPFSLGPFIQRAFAGIFFATIYFTRSFGHAAAAHALYDILVGLDALVSRR